MIGFLSLFIFSAPIDFSLGYGFGVYRTKESEKRTTLLKDRQDFVIVGMAFDAFEKYNMKWKLFPELLFQNSFVGANLWFGPESEWDIGPKHEAFYLFSGSSVGSYFSFLIDDPREPDEGGVTASQRASAAIGLQAYFGPKFKISKKFDFSIQSALRLYYGKIADTSIESPWSSNWGTVYALNFRVGFK